MPASPLTAKDVFDRVHELDTPAERQAYLDHVCINAPEIRQNVESLLKAYEEAGSLLMNRPEVTIDLTAIHQASIETPANSQFGPKTTDHTPAETLQAHVEMIDEQIGPYKPIKKLGEGGMGTVYLAQQERPIRRQVALKIIKPGMASAHILARFDAERQALTMMNHVNIARVYDAGTTEAGQPYFAMELIPGVPLTRYCKENELDIRERLKLFTTICRAVQHAHYKGIMHRDLKPSNVLVALQEGVPVAKIIDFGLAKAIEEPLTGEEQLTQFGNVLGTPDYMSPEQANMSAEGVDLRTDVYSLGVMLFELLTGTVPLDNAMPRGNLLQMVKRIVNEPPPKPSDRVAALGNTVDTIAAERKTHPAKLQAQIRGELDWITLKALEKDRDRRYQSAEALSKDVQSYLNDERVEACPPSRRYLLGKFVRKNRNLVATACAAFVLVLLTIAGLLVGFLWVKEAKDAESQAKFQAEKERDGANAARKTEQKALQIAWAGMRTQIHQQNKPGEMEVATFRNMLEQFRGLVHEEADSSEQARAIVAEMKFREANLYALIGSKEDAEASYREAIKRYERLADEFQEVPLYRTELGSCYFDLAYLMLENGNSSGAETALRRAIALLTRVTKDFPDDGFKHELADAYINLGVLLKINNKLNDAERAFREAMALLDEAIARAPQIVKYRISLAADYHNLGNVVRDRGDVNGSLEWYGKAVALLNAIQPRPTDATQCFRNACWDRANALDQLGRHDRAVTDWRNAIALNGSSEPDGGYLRQFLAASEMEIKLQAEAKPPASLFVEAAVLNATALSAAKLADEPSLQKMYANRALELLKKAKAAGYFNDAKAVMECRENKSFDPLPREEFKMFIASLERSGKNQPVKKD